ncbi:carbohydrate ABC transporter permease [Paenibacillus nasutitermitis]|uniref:Sugar ABC transporter permease n=1 Tax=Paenibacillus nasutitermitis TaxID=1652958 RepID=A0A917E1D6_9BACL|nr:sugar ABC transporter permease [Paenibacillus nasutitermitis]GGD88570.1 sugar ABC transporter permease [Paenibacillus nasutitermitis]
MEKTSWGLQSGSRNTAYTGYLFILPSFLLILTFYVLPILMTAFFSFTEFNLLQPYHFVGMANFTRMFSDPFVKASIMNTIVYTLITVPVQTFLALLIAAVFAGHTKGRWKNFVKSSTFIPVISSMIIVGVLWRMMFNAEIGFINTFLSIFGVSPINWLGGKSTSLISVCIVTIWKNVGYFLIIYYAGLMDIPRSHYEAAEVDGANRIQKFFYITIPSLRNITYLVVTLGTIWSFQVFDLVYVMTGGGPGTSTVTLVMTIYNTAFRQYNMGYASAISFLLFAIVILVSVIQKRLLNERA